MENYTIEKVNIDMHNEDVYTIRKKGRYKVYNYNHEFINESKVIKTSSCILHNGNILLELGNKNNQSMGLRQ